MKNVALLYTKLRLFMLLAGMTTAGGVAAGTLGFWTFEGAPGNVIAAETTFANKIDGTTLPMRSVDRYGNAESAGRLSTFVAPCEASSQMYIKPARVGEETPFASAYRIAGSGANGGCPLYLDDPVGALNLQTFTLEMLVRFSGNPSSWAMIASRNYHYFGAGLGTYYNGLYTTSGGDWGWNFHYCCQTNANGDVGYGDVFLGKKNLNDGKWHHISLRVNGAEQKVACYIDSVQLSVGNLPGPLAYDYADGGTVEHNPWVFGNHQVYNNYSWAGDIAAIRFSDQRVVVEDAMRLGATRSDGRTLVWLPFDADFGALANVDVQPTNGAYAADMAAKLASGKVFFTNCVENVCPVDGAGVRQRTNNTGCLALKGGYVDLAIKPYMLDVPNAITVEFFLNARLEDVQMGSWLAFLTCRHDTMDQNGNYFANRLPFVFQENGSGQIYYRADTPNLNNRTTASVKKPFDGKWHHVAITLENGVDGTNLKLTAYLDYEQAGTVTKAGTFTLEDYHFLRIGQKDKTNSIFLIDEVRISKGALGVADFLRLKGPAGTVLLFR